MASEEHAHRTHRYTAACHWSGSTAGGYEAYSRAHWAEAAPATARLELSADPVFRGDPALLNPEQLVVLAAASCQLLSFLALAARDRLHVLAYDDQGEGVMAEDNRPTRLTSIVLRPTIRVARGTNVERVARLVEVAHRECYIANSLRLEVRVEPTVEVVPAEVP